ncbi:MAG: serine--tRNA ligase [Candidatus Nealsonbacteria bacterium]|nr:serine--tRNA ligase [Candidatus Nealsonbacteria bacterium]
MLDIKFIRENPEKVKQASENKGIEVDIDRLLKLDEQRRAYIQESEKLRAEQKKIGRDNLAKAVKIKSQLKTFLAKLSEIEKEFNDLMLQVPNIPFNDVPVGKDETENVVLRKVGKPPKFRFQPKNYLEIGKKLDIIDVQRAAKVAGSRFGYLKKEAVFLEFALIKLAFDFLNKKGFIPVIPPVMVKERIAEGTGFLEGTDKQECYCLSDDNLYLTGTSEQSLVGMHADEILDEKKLPLRYFGFSTCFRREAGSYGKDTKGILRVHQFDKIEMVSFCLPENSKKEHQFLLSLEEKLMKSLNLPYRVVNICTGDLGRPAAQKYDIETWLPLENRYRETHSTSSCTDFQARRLNIRYRDKSGKLNFIHTLNGTAFAIGRTLIAIIENYQQKDGSVKVPQILQKYLNFKIIK